MVLRLRKERRHRGWTQGLVTALTGIPQSQLSAIECERLRAGANRRDRIALVFGMAEVDLFSHDEQGPEAGAPRRAGRPARGRNGR